MLEAIAGPPIELKLGGIPYLNAEPFCTGLAELGVVLQKTTPAVVGRLAAEDLIDAAPLSLVDYFRLSETFEPLGNFCIATARAAQSVLLFSVRPLEELCGATIAVSAETATSVELLKTLLANRYGVFPASYVDVDEPCDARLLIGDAALRERRGPSRFTYLYDLGVEWYVWTGLPFVFAVWAMRRDLPGSTKRALRGVVGNGLRRGLQRFDRIAASRGDTALNRREIIVYLRGFRYVLGREERRAVSLFQSLIGPW
jgi:chorismate dehydratase